MENLNIAELKEFIDFKAEQYNRTSFIDLDPISIPHKYKLKEDIGEISIYRTNIA